MLAGIAGAAVGAWLWRRRRHAGRTALSAERGEIIYSNAPLPSSEGIL
jgi:hypothetical protein